MKKATWIVYHNFKPNPRNLLPGILKQFAGHVYERTEEEAMASALTQWNSNEEEGLTLTVERL